MEDMDFLVSAAALVLAITGLVGTAWCIAKLVDLVLAIQDRLTLAWLRRMPARLRRLNR
ncbi:hypothetical protein [Cupriavidus campinensis]|uniref:hypothetical protein n=1 Tax=Cupriavidus campinensis TaxID=151783 RepID=UPI0016434EBB|nr:hypothetical protein [Cupriavidus campinensis]